MKHYFQVVEKPSASSSLSQRAAESPNNTTTGATDVSVVETSREGAQQLRERLSKQVDKITDDQVLISPPFFTFLNQFLLLLHFCVLDYWQRSRSTERGIHQRGPAASYHEGLNRLQERSVLISIPLFYVRMLGCVSSSEFLFIGCSSCSTRDLCSEEDVQVSTRLPL